MTSARRRAAAEAAAAAEEPETAPEPAAAPPTFADNVFAMADLATQVRKRYPGISPTLAVTIIELNLRLMMSQTQQPAGTMDASDIPLPDGTPERDAEIAEALGLPEVPQKEENDGNE